MKRAVSYLLVLLTLFTHSAMAMDLHISFEENHHHEAEFSLDTLDSLVDSDLVKQVFAEPENEPCSDAGGHCSHHNAHTSGLAFLTAFPSVDNRPVYNAILKSISISHKLAPPFRPPIS